MDLEQVPVEKEPDIETECPNCNGTVAVWLYHHQNDELNGLGICSIEAVVHIGGESHV